METGTYLWPWNWILIFMGLLTSLGKWYGHHLIKWNLVFAVIKHAPTGCLVFSTKTSKIYQKIAIESEESTILMLD